MLTESAASLVIYDETQEITGDGKIYSEPEPEPDELQAMPVVTIEPAKPNRAARRRAQKRVKVASEWRQFRFCNACNLPYLGYSGYRCQCKVSK